ncbi:MAG: hypothetical protein ACRD20_02450 [Terriglobales bacterium]
MTYSSVVIRLTRSQQIAMMDLITEFVACSFGHSELFQDTSSSPAISTTPGELLRLVSGGRCVELPE